MKRVVPALVAAVLLSGMLAGQGRETKPLQIWVADTEGGKAALYVTPTGQSVLVDTGFPGVRDLDRILAVIADAGVKQIDYLLSTHYHVDHIGGLQELAKRIPVAHYVDHGPTVEGPVTTLREQVPGFQAAYAELYSKAKRTVVKPGDRLPVTGVEWRIATSAGNILKTALAGGGKPNPACTGFVPPQDKSNLRDPDDAQSVGSVVVLGEFRSVDFGDMWWTRELELMCPNNPIGAIDLYFASSHGADASGSLPFVHGLQPRVALLQNGTRKGAAVNALRTIRSSPGLEDVWQMHWTHNGGIEHNSAGVFIANVDDAATIAGVLTAPARGGGPGRGQNGAAPAAGAQPGPAPAASGQTPATAPPPPQAAPAPTGSAAPQAAAPAGRGRGNAAAAHSPAYWLKISAQPDGTFTITNSRNGFSKTYVRRSARR